MARRRYISTDISTDDKVNQISNLAKLLYTWAMPHFADNCRITPQNAAELKMAILPGLREGPKEVQKAMNEIFAVGLWGRDEDGRIFIPSNSFYKYQTYINAANRRKTPQNTASSSSSSSPSLSLSPLSEAGKNKKKPEKRKKASPYPSDFQVTPEILSLARENEWPDPHSELEAFRDFHISKGSRFVEWDRAFHTWLRNSKKFSGRTDGKPKATQGLDTLKAWAKRSGILDKT